ncbi:MAG: cell division protein ZapA [Desulforhabdus sp.]|nr:cell division protein ZapA [Desulforhabdus sp.]
MERLITIDVFGQAYTFKAESGVVDPVEVSDYLMGEIRKVEAQQAERSAERNRVALLLQTALNVANENIKMRHMMAELVQDVAGRSDRLISLLDDSLPSGSIGRSAA